MSKLTTTIRLRPETVVALDHCSKKHNCTKSEYVELSLNYMFSQELNELPEIMKKKVQIEKNPKYKEFCKQYYAILKEEGIKID